MQKNRINFAFLIPGVTALTHQSWFQCYKTFFSIVTDAADAVVARVLVPHKAFSGYSRIYKQRLISTSNFRLG
jgi:hypothetical protein